MSPLRAGRARVVGVSAETLLARSDALAEAVELGGAQLPTEPAQEARRVTTKVRERLAITGGHSIVALAGATGSGKSSLFNALVGSEVAQTGVRRPTTSTTTAATWGSEPVGELLDWLSVAHRHHVAGSDGSPLDGLVLLDMPDFDSRETGNRDEAERALQLVDVFIWVTDPQKYADARLHDDYVKALAAHDAVTLVLLNQVDRLTPEQTEQCVADLTRLLRADGLEQARVLPVSARTGQGLDSLRERLSNAVAGRNAARTRLAADVRTAAAALRPAFGPQSPTVGAGERRALQDALAQAAGVPVVVETVRKDFAHRAVAETGLPWTRWLRRLRPSPLRRMRLDGDTTVDAEIAQVSRSSLPTATPTARAAVDLASRRMADKVSAGLPVPWAEAIHDAASPSETEVADAVDQAIVGTPLRGKRPVWMPLLGALQTVLAIVAVLGLLWLVVLAVLGWLQLPEIETPTVGWFPVPMLMLVGGLVVGALLALLSRWFASVGARRRARAADKKLRAAIDEVAVTRIVGPVQEVLERRTAAVAALERAID